MERLGQHDMGGLEEEVGPIDRREPGYVYWERQVHATILLLMRRGLLSTDELRRAIEALPGYSQLSYYHKWTKAAAAICIEKKALLQADWEAELGQREESHHVASFAVGQAVRVRREDSRIRWRRPHIRTPGYLFDCPGVIDRVLGVYPNPEELSFESASGSASVQPLYLVTFRQVDLWKDIGGGGYGGDEGDTTTAEVYEPWLVEEKGGEMEGRRRQEGRSAAAPRGGVVDHGDHVHDTRHDTEAEAARREEAHLDAGGEAASQALLRCLGRAGLVTVDQVRQLVETMDAKGQLLLGAKLTAKAWTDSGYKERLLSDANAAARELGVEASNPNAPTKLVVFENTEETHHMVVCTLCSCYPTSLLGMPPPWYKSRSYRARGVREPREVLKEFGLCLQGNVKVQVHDSTADCRYMILPRRPAGTEAWSEAELEAIVTRDCLVGVAVPDLNVRRQ